MNSRHHQADCLATQLRTCESAIDECGVRVDVATDDVKVQMLGDLADALRERHVRIQRKIAAVRSAMGLPQDPVENGPLSDNWARLHPRQRLAVGATSTEERI